MNTFLVNFFNPSIRIQVELDAGLDPDPHYNVCMVQSPDWTTVSQAQARGKFQNLTRPQK